jgi:hypothetical protein
MFLANGATKPEMFLLWDVPDSNWISRSLNLSLLRDALVNKLHINLTIPTATSSFINSVELLNS